MSVRDYLRDPLADAWSTLMDKDISEGANQLRRVLDAENQSWESMIMGVKPYGYQKIRMPVHIPQFQATALEKFAEFERKKQGTGEPRNAAHFVESYVLPVFFHRTRALLKDVMEMKANGRL